MSPSPTKFKGNKKQLLEVLNELGIDNDAVADRMPSLGEKCPDDRKEKLPPGWEKGTIPVSPVDATVVRTSQQATMSTGAISEGNPESQSPKEDSESSSPIGNSDFTSTRVPSKKSTKGSPMKESQTMKSPVSEARIQKKTQV